MKLTVKVGLAAGLAVAGILGTTRYVIAECDDPCGSITFVDRPCAGVCNSGNGAYHISMTLHHSGGSIVVTASSAESFNLSSFYVSKDGGDWLDILETSQVFDLENDKGVVWDFQPTYVCGNRNGSATIKMTPTGETPRRWGWMTAKAW